MAVLVLLPLCWGVLIGIILGKLIAIPGWFVVKILFVGLIGAFLSIVYSAKQIKVFVACLGICLGVMLWQNSLVLNEYETVFGSNVETTGRVIGVPSITSSGNQAVVVKLDNFSQYLRASLFFHSYLSGGEKVWIRGKIKQPENFEGFDYVSYLKQNNIYGQLDKARIIRIGDNSNYFESKLLKIRNWVIRATNQNLNSQTAAIVLGMLIGEKSLLDRSIEQAFQKTGLIHILVVSGFNLTIIASGVAVMARVIGRRWADLGSLVIIWMFVILVGGSAAVVRAGVMASLVLLSRVFGRLAISNTSLLVAVVVMGVINPWRIFYDVGFQLSIAATFGVLKANYLRVEFRREGFIAELLWPSLGAIIFTAPIVAYYFGTFSIVAPLSNLIVLPLVPFVMLFGALAIVPVISLVFIPVTQALNTAMLFVVQKLADWPFSQVEIRPDFNMVIVFYLILLIVLSILKLRSKSRLKELGMRAKMDKIII